MLRLTRTCTSGTCAVIVATWSCSIVALAGAAMVAMAVGAYRPDSMTASLGRVEDDRLLTGRGTFVANLPLDGMLFATFVRSTEAHARLVAVRIEKAAAHPGVVAVLRSADLGDVLYPSMTEGLPPAMDRPVLARDDVRYVGQPIVLIVAESDAIGADAAALVEIEYERRRAVVSVESARDGAPLYDGMSTNVLVEHRMGPGADFTGCEVIVERRIVNQRISGAPIESRAAVASWDGERLTQWATSQGAHPTRDVLVKTHGLDPSKIRVIIPDVGGGFGSKARIHLEEIAIGFASRRLGRPVQWVESRSESMLCLPHGRGQVQRLRLGGTRDGHIRAYELTVDQDTGGYAMLAPFLARTTGRLSPGPYKLDNMAYVGRAVLTSTGPVSAYRGAARPEATAAIERAMDLYAAEIGMDPVELRRRNLLAKFTDGHTTAVGERYDTGDYLAALDRLVEVAGYDDLRARQRAQNSEGAFTRMGIGVAVYVEVTGGALVATYASAELTGDGTVHVVSGATPTGQGHDTVWARIVAERTGVSPAQVSVTHGDTDVLPHSPVTGGSRTMQSGAPSMVAAAESLVALARVEASSLLEAAAEDVVLDLARGVFHVAGMPARSVSWSDIAEAAAGLKGVGEFAAPQNTFPYGAHLAVVQVDVETGSAVVERFVAVDEAGMIIDHAMADGQVHGGIASGIGQALYEEIVYSEDGQLRSGTFADYMLVSAAELPSFETHVIEAPTYVNPMGAKGIGESGAIGATPAVQNAVVDALAGLGVRHIDLPMTPERVWQALRDVATTTTRQVSPAQ